MKEGGFMEEEWTKFLQLGPGQFADLLSCYRRTFSEDQEEDSQGNRPKCQRILIGHGER